MAQIHGVKRWWRGRSRGWEPTPEAPSCVVLPGIGYTPEHPLLFWASTALVEEGWHVLVVEWDISDIRFPEDVERAEAFIRGAFARACEDVPRGRPDLLIGKSLGTLATGAALEAGADVVAMTPLMTEGLDRFYPTLGMGADTGVVVGERGGVAGGEKVGPRVLAIGGTADHWWDAGIARSHGFAVDEVGDGDHSLQIRGDWKASLHVVEDVTARVVSFACGRAGLPDLG